MSMAFRTCPECRWNKVGHYCGKQMTLNGFECINYEKKEKEKINNNTRRSDNMKKIITKTSEEARREKELEQEREKLTCPECNNYDTKNLINKNDNNKYRCTKCGCEWRCEAGLTGPVEPLGIQWVSVNMESQGTCPNCGNLVVDGYSRIDRTCPVCGIKLIWRDQ